MKSILSILMVFFALVGGAHAQEKVVTGQVTDRGSNLPLQGVEVSVLGKYRSTHTGQDGKYSIKAADGDKLVFSFIAFQTQTVKVGKKTVINIALQAENQVLEEIVVTGVKGSPKMNTVGYEVASASRGIILGRMPMAEDAETYKNIDENAFKSPLKDPLSTFAADVDAASYSNVRRMINAGNLPDRDAVRVEEMINYFQYDLKAPTNGDPVRIYTELGVSPWNKEHQLLRIALKAKDIPSAQLPASNFVFLIDVSGSMYAANKLPLVKSSLKLLVDQLRDQDRVAIVTYAGSAGVKLESTSGSQKMKIKEAIDELVSGGSTAGGAGIRKAYDIARQNFMKNGNNRIILASDGDFNVGASSDDDMEKLISKERESGVHLTVLGFGMGNLKDSKMELLANKGHGNYAYIDNISEARKAMVTEFGGTLFTVAKDVKIQIEFNPAYVQAYRLVGYENRLLAADDFNNDAKLGGDMGVGHSVTAIYEIVPVGVKSSIIGTVDALKYQDNKKANQGTLNGELATVKFRYKEPESDKSKLQQVVVSNKMASMDQMSEDFRFATAVAELGMLLRNSDYKQESSYNNLVARAKAAKGKDDEGYRAEFIRMAENAAVLDKR
ncbi:von Willebrand factor type A domain-containing protein [Sphingobacterium sp. BN32]|uniref:vWA domain-containing protein n=1 Tax=Sphingobacterium sp. BN32 TaxID=3058432 RepID=UPI00265CEC6E|nr:von Willebrand factor type A domain-containing protein [Sphingobacterium sp. BN32]WKK57743.1 von Willebrand factor type A domain-containing protein [Sphingobacterium sp. BN32]